MKLTSIKLCNFRQFYGKTPEILLAWGNECNTTVIHGNNGAGKTGLLNAFTWVLYEKFSAAFASVEQLVNKRAIAEAQLGDAIECWVEVGWEHDGKRYLAKRMCRVYKNETDFDAGKSELYMQVAGDDGRWYLPPQQPDEIINQIYQVVYINISSLMESGLSRLFALIKKLKLPKPQKCCWVWRC